MHPERAPDLALFTVEWLLARDHEVRLDLEQLRRAETEPFHDAVREVVDDHVRLRDEPARRYCES